MSEIFEMDLLSDKILKPSKNTSIQKSETIE